MELSRNSIVFHIYCLILFQIFNPFENETLAKTEKEIVVKSWNAQDHVFLQILEPPQLQYLYKATPPKNFGPIFNITLSGVKLIKAQPVQGCSTLANARQINGRIALIERGGCSFVSKVVSAQKAGAIAAIIFDHVVDDHKHVSMVKDETARDVDIPSAFISGRDGSMIVSTMERLGLRHALVTLPVNITHMPNYQVYMPPWSLW